MTEEQLAAFHLKHNPFEPSASGPPLGMPIWLPDRWKERLGEIVTTLADARGVKSVIISGEYGLGKTSVLRWLHETGLAENELGRVLSFYFDNPGVQFYDLANQLLREIGRKEFAKRLWEYVAPHAEGPTYQMNLFARGFEEYLKGQRTRSQIDVTAEIQDAIVKSGITDDEEVAHGFARIVTDYPKKPYFEYRDFSAGKRSAIVPEQEEAKYFSALLRFVQQGSDAGGVAFLIDEFEEISLQKNLTRRQAQDYFTTLKRLVNLAQEEGLFLFLAMTPEGVEKTSQLDPALWERLTTGDAQHFELDELTDSEARELVANRLHHARPDEVQDAGDVWPFPEEFPAPLNPTTYSSPRRLVKFCFHMLENAMPDGRVHEDVMKEQEEQLYPPEADGDDE